jgi:hypothetical protein
LVAADPAGTNPNVDAAITTATSEVQTRDLRLNTPDLDMANPPCFTL